MNDLSWALYFADIFTTLSGFFSFLAITGGVAVCVAVFMKFYSFSDEYDYSNDSEQRDRFIKFNKLLAYFGLPALLVFGTLSSIMPEKDTMYLIVASEAGEYVIDSETGQKTIAVVNAFLDSKLEEFENETTEPETEETPAAEEQEVLTPELRDAIADTVENQIRQTLSENN